MKPIPSLVVFSDDWGRHPSSCQHLVSRLLDEYDVTWVNTIGTRPPTLSWATIRRGFQKLREWGSRPESRRPSGRTPRVLAPLMWPTFRTRWSRALNCRLISAHLKQRVPNLQSSIVLTTIPLVADLVRALPASRWIYYCVDDFAEWPGLDGATLRQMEDDLIRSVDQIVAAGDRLADRIRDQGRNPLIITHGVELEHWKQAELNPSQLPELARAERPIALFWGLIDARLDVEWLLRLGTAMRSGTIVLVGPTQDPDRALSRVPRVRFTGPLGYQDLPAVAAAADVLIMPYADLPVTRAMQPLKLKEYMATGKPVVARSLPAVQPWNACLDAVEDADAFAARVMERASSGLPKDQNEARGCLQQETWEAKAEMLRRVLAGDYIGRRLLGGGDQPPLETVPGPSFPANA
jgi:glycosyltransferase involved in cell wall biosynthesis